MNLKTWFANKRKEFQLRQWKRGYDWAAGALLRHEESPRSIEEKIFSPFADPPNSFDHGAWKAVKHLINLKIIEDNRI